MSQNPIPQHQNCHAPSAAALAPPSKKTEPYKESINETTATNRHLRELLAEAYERISILEGEMGISCDVVPVFGMTPTETRIFRILLARPNVKKSSLMTLLFSDRAAEDDIPSIRNIDVHVCKMRRKLRRFGIRIETVWGQGLRISEANKTIATALMDGKSS